MGETTRLAKTTAGMEHEHAGYSADSANQEIGVPREWARADGSSAPDNEDDYKQKGRDL